MRDRLPALDGLRGLAALGVVLGHISFQPQLISSFPPLVESYRALAVGPNSVQTLFVLCGFFMAFLYPSITNKRKFIQKRYTRIFPVFSAIVLYIWLTTLEEFGPWYLQPFLLIGIAGLFYLSWKFLRKADPTGRIGKYIFYAFVFLQILMVVLSLTILPKIILYQTISVPEHVKNILIALSNITLTTPLVLGLKRLSFVFWSLAPEVLFYLIYPIIVIPLIKIGKRYGIVGSLVIIGTVTKILFDLDFATLSFGSIQSMSLARAAGFVAGVTIGTIYQTKGEVWQILQKLLSNKFVNILVILSFIFVQWGDGAIRDGQSLGFINLYYLLSSWVFALVLAAAIIPTTTVYKILRHKIFVGLGIISYSMYLIHTQVVGWVEKLFLQLGWNRDISGTVSILHLVLSLILTFIVAKILFMLIERLYFEGKKNNASKKDKATIVVSSSKRSVKPYLFIISLILLSIGIYAGPYSPTFTLSRHSFFQNKDKEVSLLSGPIKASLDVKENNLSLITAHMRYRKDSGNTKRYMNPPASLNFRLLSESGKIIASSSAIAYEVEGAANFPFGIVPIPDSRNKKYIIEYSLSHGSKDDQVYIDTSSTSLVAAYTHSEKKDLKMIFRIICNRTFFALTNPAAIFLLLTIFSVGYFLRKAR